MATRQAATREVASVGVTAAGSSRDAGRLEAGALVVASRSRITVQRALPAVALAVLVGSLLVRLVGAGLGLPVLTGDQILFLPVAREWLVHGQLQHPFISVEGAGSHEYNWHGWLYPLVIAAFPTSRHAQTLLLGPTLLCVASVLVFWAYARVARLGARRAALLLTLIGATATYQIGRPESSLTLLWGSALILQRRLPARHFDRAAALLLGVAIITQPPLSAAAYVAFVLYAACTRDSLRTLAASAARVAIGALLSAFLLTILCSPLTLASWLRGLLANATYVATRTDGGLREALHYLIALPTFPLAAAYLLLAGLAARQLPARPATPGLRRATAAAAALLALFIAATAIRLPATVYNLIAFAPPIAALALAAAPSTALNLTLAASTAAALASLTFAALSLLTASTGTSLHNLQTELRHLQPCAIAPDPSSWLAVEQALGRARICPPHAPCPTRLILQANSGLLEPPPRLHPLALTTDHFHRTPPAILGLRLGNTRKDYAHALYGEPIPCGERLVAE